MGQFNEPWKVTNSEDEDGVTCADPWSVQDNEQWYLAVMNTGVPAFAGDVSDEKARAERIASCINAMEDIDDPEGFVKRAREAFRTLRAKALAEIDDITESQAQALVRKE